MDPIDVEIGRVAAIQRELAERGAPINKTSGMFDDECPMTGMDITECTGVGCECEPNGWNYNA